MATFPFPTLAEGDAITRTWLSDHLQARMNLTDAHIVTTEGDIILATAANATDRFAIGTNGYLLEADSGEATGRKWATSGLVPLGGIVIWSGAIVDIPDNWQICDGTNSTPDLRNRFVVGAGDTYAVTDTGGAASMDLEHSHTLTSPTASDGAHTHTQANATGGSHTHTISANTNNENTTAGSCQFIDVTPAQYQHTHSTGGGNTDAATHEHTNPTTGSDGAHTHTIADTGTDNQLSATQSNLPAYYALAYIQRMA